MKWLKLPSQEGKPLWGGLFWAIPMVYIFFDPYQRHADWVEWLVTSIAFAFFAVCYTMALIYWSRKRIIQRLCIAIALLAMTFSAYRPSGVVFFVLVGALCPLAVSGNILRSAMIIFGVVLLLELEWWIFWPADYFPHVMSLQALIIGAGTTFASQQQLAISSANKVAERERIARDLHDILGHTLSSIILKSELAGRLLDQDLERARAEITDVETIARKALGEVRQAIHGYHEGDLQAEFRRAQSMLEASAVTVETHYEATNISVTQERVLILALREAVTNIVRHAQATRCRIQLRQLGTDYRLDVTDDGRGGGEEGLGIRGMRHRVESLGGSLSWQSNLGTVLMITLPVARD